MPANKNQVNAAALFMFALLLAAVAYTQAPQLHSIDGTIYNASGPPAHGQTYLGTPFSINNSNSGDYLRSRTNVPVPGLSGRYSETINGTDGDLVIIHAWNLTYYGTTNRTLLGDMSGVNVYLNETRPPEANVTIIVPANHSIYNESGYFNITANVSIIGADGLECNATISISNATLINVSATDGLFTHKIGNINRGSYNTTTWNLTAKAVNDVNRTLSNVTISALCRNEGVNLEKEAVKKIFNISVTGAAPVVRLMSPANNTVVGVKNVNFTFNVSDISNLKNCSLLINNIINASNSSVLEKNVRQGINVSLNDSLYNFSVQCIDTSGNIGLSEHHNITVNSSGFIITNLEVSDPIFLTPGTTTIAWCNATLTPINNFVNVSIFNATLFDNLASAYEFVDDNNDHYINTSCANVTKEEGSSGLNVSCSFYMWYYSNNASWTCDFRAKDTNGLSIASTTNTVVYELLAVNSTEQIDYGDLQVGDTSEDRNVTIFNLGNVPINITTYGYARTIGDNLSMMCGENNLNGNISVGNQRHYGYFDTDYSEMTPLGNHSDYRQVLNISIYQRTSDSGHTNDYNTSFWKLKVPEGVGGKCNGTIILNAIAANLSG